jgi:glycosyltransferase involved in cell wall biosynthesis
MQTDRPKMRISVVVIVFNLERYICEAIDSVLRQTRKADEVIVVDDCSTDASAERVKAYGTAIRYVRMPTNSGALLTALEGVKATSGDVICMLDGDDYWEANKLAVVEREFCNNPALLLLSHDHVRVSENGAELRIRDDTHRNIASLQHLAKSSDEFSDLLKTAILNQKGYWLGSAYAFRRKLFALSLFKEQIEDFDFDRLKQTYLDLVIAPFLVLTNPDKPVGYTAETRFYYRVHGKGSLAGNSTPEKAIYSAGKGRSTNELILLILQKNGAAPTFIERRQLLLREYDFLCALYRRNYKEAVQLYVRLLTNHWNGRQIIKETTRLLAVMTLGPEKFLKLKNAA